MFFLTNKKIQIFMSNPKAHKIKLAQILNNAYNFYGTKEKIKNNRKKLKLPLISWIDIV